MAILSIGVARRLPSLMQRQLKEVEASEQKFDGVFHQDIDRMIIKHQEGSERMVDAINEAVEQNIT